ncbi:MAG: histidine phosphotransferase family protein [Brevirhabdus sp.]
MSSDPEPLAAKVSARLCHDLVNPLGAISNGLELLELSGLADTAEFELIRASVAEATGRLRFLRMAFGPGNPDDIIDRDAVLSLVHQRYEGGSTSVGWESEDHFSRAEAKAVLLALLALEWVTARGGRITATGRDGVWTLNARSRSPIVDQSIWQGLANRDAPPDPPASQIHLTALCRHMSPEGRALTARTDAEGVRLNLSF